MSPKGCDFVIVSGADLLTFYSQEINRFSEEKLFFDYILVF